MQKSSQKSKPGEFTFDDLIHRVIDGPPQKNDLTPQKKGKKNDLTPQRLIDEIHARTQKRQQIRARADEWGRELPEGEERDDIPADLLRSFEQDLGLQAGAVGVPGAVAGVAEPPRVPAAVCATDYQGTFTGPKFEDVIPAAGMAEVKPFNEAVDDPSEKNAAFCCELEAWDGQPERWSLDAGSWRFETIAQYARSRPGHNFVTWPYLSFAEGAWKTARDLVEATRRVHPSLSNEGIATVCLSVQARQHLVDVFKLFGDSNEARNLAGGDLAPAQRSAELTTFFAAELLAKYAAALDVAPTETAPDPVTGPAAITEASTPATGEDSSKCRTEAISAYKLKCKQAGIKVTDEMIGQKASPKWTTRTQVSKFKSGKSGRPCDDRLIWKVLKAEPNLPRMTQAT